MRVFEILLTLLIAEGISGSDISTEIDDSSEISEAELIEFWEALKESFKESVQEECYNRTDGSTAFNNFEQGLIKFKQCTESLLEVEKDNSDKSDSSDSDMDWRKFFKSYCRDVVPTLSRCIEDLTDTMKPCFDEEAQKEIDEFNEAKDTFNQFLCFDDGRRLASFIDNDGIECVASNLDELFNCTEDISGNYSQTDIQKLISIDQLELQECEDIERLRNCTVSTMQRCENPKPATILETAFNFLSMASSCEKVLDKDIFENLGYGVDGKDVSGMEESLKRFIRNKCEANGGPAAYVELMDSFKLSSRSYQLVMNYTELNEKANISYSAPNPPSIEALNIIFKEFCRRMPIVMGVDKYTTESVKPCLESDEKISYDILHEITVSTSEFLCQNEGNRLSSLVATSGGECFASKKDALLTCAKRSFSDYIFDTILAFRFDGKLPLIQSDEFSEDLVYFRNCTNDIFADCENKLTSELLNGVIDSIQEVLSKEVKTPVTDSESSEVREEPEVFNLLTGIDDAKSLNMSDEEVEKFLREECTKNGGPDAYDGAKGIPVSVTNGLQKIKDDAILVAQKVFHSDDYNQEVKVKELVKIYCEKVPWFEKQVTYIKDSIKPCLEFEDKEDLEVAYNVTLLSLDFACENGGERVLGLFSDKSVKCLAASEQGVENCNNDILTSNSSKVSHFKECKELKNYQQCILNLFEDCEDPTPKVFFGSWIDELIKVTDCKDSINP